MSLTGMFSFKRNKTGIMHALSGEFRETTAYPFVFGYDADAHWQFPSADNTGEVCRIETGGKGLAFTFSAVQQTARLDGEPASAPCTRTLESDRVISLLIAGEPFLIFPQSHSGHKPEGVDTGVWDFEDGQSGQPVNSGALPETVEQWLREKRAIDTLAGLPRGVNACPFWIEELTAAREIMNTFDAGGRQKAGGWDFHASAEAADHTCPACWLGFDTGSMLAIAAHDDLTDPVLGNDERLRFEPVQFSVEGHPLDPMGLPATGFACPHCRHRLPTGFHEIPHHIFSLVGASQAGKSYYLSILIHQLQRMLFRQFKLAFRDQDPQANAILNEMKQRVFQSSRPEDAYLVKTQLEGEMYMRLRRHGKEVALPRPFVYQLSAAGQAEQSVSVIFYDNAGEHFQPQVRIEDSPGALHVAASSAIFFLFDPAPNPNFRALLDGYPDPQLTTAIPDGQDVIMAEMESRIKRISHVAANRRIDTPLAVMIGKCDIWKHLINWDDIRATAIDGELDMTAIEHNSKIIREFMLRLEPSIVANAEALSSNVCFFAVSSFGHSPRKLRARDSNVDYLAPEPSKIQPIGIETPTLWALRQVTPHFMPIR